MSDLVSTGRIRWFLLHFGNPYYTKFTVVNAGIEEKVVLIAEFLR